MTLPDQSDTAWARWCFETCLIFGCDAVTAARVTAIFVAATTPYLEAR